MPISASRAKEGGILSADVGKEQWVFGRVAVVVVESDRSADSAHVGVELEKGGSVVIFEVSVIL